MRTRPRRPATRTVPDVTGRRRPNSERKTACGRFMALSGAGPGAVLVRYEYQDGRVGGTAGSRMTPRGLPVPLSVGLRARRPAVETAPAAFSPGEVADRTSQTASAALPARAGHRLHGQSP